MWRLEIVVGLMGMIQYLAFILLHMLGARSDGTEYSGW